MDKPPTYIRVANREHWTLTLCRSTDMFSWWAEIKAKNRPEDGQIVGVELVDGQIVYRGRGVYDAEHDGIAGMSDIRVYPLGESVTI